MTNEELQKQLEIKTLECERYFNKVNFNLRITIKETKDNFCGNYGKNENLVEVRFCYSYPNKNWRVDVWGDDDFGIIFETKDRDEALSMFNKLCEMEFIEQEELYKLGFVNF